MVRISTAGRMNVNEARPKADRGSGGGGGFGGGKRRENRW
jgi:hypothetical protein